MRVPEHQRKSYVWRWTAALAALAVLAFALATSVTMAPSQHAQAATFTVDTLLPGAGLTACTAAADDCSLPGALSVADGNGVTDTITFLASLSGAIPIAATLTLSEAFATTITGPTDHSVRVSCAAAFDGFTITSDGNTIKNLVINGCTNGVTLSSADSNTIAGNRIGTNGPGTVPVPNTGNGVNIIGTSTLNTIGGTATADRNLISGNTGNGVDIAGSASVNTIRGNYIGTDVTGSAAAIGNAVGINITGTAASNPIRDNVIGGNTGAGVVLGAAGGNTVYGNSIGLGADGAAIMGNGAQGILNSAGTNVIGGTASGQPNTIAHNTGVAVDVTAGAANIRRNSMFLNGGTGGITNAGGPAMGTIAVGTFGGGTFTIGGAAAAAFAVVEVFLADPDGDEGETFVQSYPVDGAGDWGGSLCVTGPVRIMATATDTTANNTSAFVFKDLPVGVCVVATNTPVPTNTSSVPTDTPTKTNTPTNTGTRTNTPTNTPTGTRTPTPGAMQTVSLAGGVCNPVASTYANGTATSVLAAAVTPTTALRSIWKFQANVWTGYDPLHPNDLNISDLRTVSFLDSIFICLTANATFQRPQVSS